MSLPLCLFIWIFSVLHGIGIGIRRRSFEMRNRKNAVQKLYFKMRWQRAYKREMRMSRQAYSLKALFGRFGICIEPNFLRCTQHVWVSKRVNVYYILDSTRLINFFSLSCEYVLPPHLFHSFRTLCALVTRTPAASRSRIFKSSLRFLTPFLSIASSSLTPPLSS